jgi:hypothetical protein
MALNKITYNLYYNIVQTLLMSNAQMLDPIAKWS